MWLDLCKYRSKPFPASHKFIFMTDLAPNICFLALLKLLLWEFKKTIEIFNNVFKIY